MTETDVPEPDYDAMSPSDRAFALFTAVEAARSKAIAKMREAGREIDYDEAHQAAIAVWNAWAQPLLEEREEREELEEAGIWEVQYEFSIEASSFSEIGKNAETQDFLRRADLSARSFSFFDAYWQEENEEEWENISSDPERSITSIFCGPIIICNFPFPSNADFRETIFYGDTNFFFAKFSGNVSFSRATFNGITDFTNAEFMGKADFTSTIFNEVSDFNSTTFNGFVSFDETVFKGDGDFDNTAFNEGTSFNSSSFKGSAYFSSTVLEGETSFDSVTFNNDTNFTSAAFKGKTHFSRTKFKGIALFDSVTFKGDTSFILATFKNIVSFSGAEFEGGANFRQVDFLSHASFLKTVFSLNSNWNALNAVRAFELAGARFETRVPQFTQAHFTESPRMDNVTLPRLERWHSSLPAPQPEADWVTTQVHSLGWAGGVTPDDEDSMHPIQAKWEELKEGEELGDAPEGETRREIERDGKRYRYRERETPKPKTGKPINADDIAAFTALRRIAMQGEDHETERKAFKGEMRTRRVAGELGWAYNISSWAYDLFTSFGASFMRPLFLWAVLTLASAGVYAVAANNTKPAGCDTPIIASTQLSLHNALLFATAGQRSFVQEAQLCLYGQEAETKRSAAPAWLGIYGTAQTLLSAILIFFILLALRNRFKI